MSMTCENWLRRPPLLLDALRPVDHHAVARAAEVGRHLLGPGERRIERHRPAGRHVREGFRTAPLVDERDQILHLLGDAVEVGHLVVHADEAALGAGAVVAGDVDEHGVVELADVRQRLPEPPDLVVGVLQESGEHFGLAREQTPLIGRQRVPRGQVLRPLAQPRVGRNHAQLLLPLERFVPHLVPALVELALVLVGPFLRHVVRRMRRARSRNTR